jgi:hypothetical protein
MMLFLIGLALAPAWGTCRVWVPVRLEERRARRWREDFDARWWASQAAQVRAERARKQASA